MVTPEIIAYIKNQISSGISIDTIKASLIQSGWQINDINDAINQITSSNTTNPDTSPTIPSVITQNNNVTVSASAPPKSPIISIISILFFLLSFINLRLIIIFIVLIDTLNKGMIKSFAGALPYSGIKYIPFVGLAGILSLIPMILYLFLAFKVRSGSKSAWKTSLILTIFILIFQLILSGVLFITTRQVYDRTSM